MASDVDLYLKKNKKGRFFYLKLFLIFVLVFGIVLGGLWVVFRSNLFVLKNIEIRGNAYVSQDEIISGLQKNIFNNSKVKYALGMQNILSWPGEFKGGDLSFIPRIKNIIVDKNYFSKTVVLNVEERTPAGTWCRIGETGKNCFWFDDSGFIFDKAPDTEGNIVRTTDDYYQKNIGVNSFILPQDHIKNYFSIIQALDDSGVSVKEIRLENLDLEEMKVLTYGPVIYFSLRYPSDNAAQVIRSLGSKLNTLQYIDFRTENRAYYK